MTDILQGLNKAQKEGVTTTEGPLLIIAGAGTGKTTVITHRIAHIIEKKLAKPSEILALTFTEKAAGEMEERVDVLVPYGYIDTWISTFHAFGNRVLQENAINLGLPADFRVMTRPQQVLFFQQNLFSFNLDYYRPLSNPTKFIEAILSFISRAKDEDITPEQYLQYVQKLKVKSKKEKIEKEEKEELKAEIARQEELANAYKKYEELKEAAGFLDFGDQVVMTLRLFRDRPKILREYQDRFKYILVDEYQDTNWAQNELVKLLAGAKKNICVVADDDQSIYRFRGAAISNVLEFKKTYPKAKIVSLIENYRSTQLLLDSAYRLIKHNDPDRLEVREKISKKLVATRKEKGKAPTEIYADTLSEEADLVAKEIEKLRKKEKGKSQKYNYKDIAILVRANAQADPFLRALNMKGITHKFVGSSGLYNQPEVKLLISYLSAITNFDDSLNLYNLASSEIYKLPIEDAIVAMDFAKRKNKTLRGVFEKVAGGNSEVRLSEEGMAIVEKIIEDLQNAVELSQKENVGRVLYDFLKKTGYLSRLEREGSVESEIKIQNISRFFDKIKEFVDLVQNESARAFVDYLETMRGVGDDPATVEFDPDLDAVNIMTVHSAKGLEFPIVFMVNLVSDRFPSRMRGDPIALPDDLIKETLPSGDFHMQEERRLFYVGMTRSEDRLYFSWARDMGGKRNKKVSPYVLEALDKIVSEATLVKLSPTEKIEQFAPSAPKKYQLPQSDQKIIKLTQGSIGDYQTCAYKYRYVHVLRLPILRHHAVVYGFSLHAAVAEFYRQKMQGKKITFRALLDVLENTWVTEGFLSAEHEEKRLVQAKKVLEEFYKREKDSKDVPTFIEKNFRFTVGDIFVTGRFDRVDVNKDKVRVIDFKSTENRSREQLEKDAKGSVQLRIYALGYYKAYQVVPEFVGIYDLESGIVGGYTPTKEALKKTEEEIKDVARAVRTDLLKDSFEANPKYFGRLPACYYCAYSSICPFSLARG
jgi:DNA helicase-2/ATP-dependent DNA helicase PcrA